MKKINIESYTVKVQGQGENGKNLFLPYDLLGSIRVVLFDPRQQLNDIQLCEAMDIWNKIKDEKKEIILEEAEYKVLKKSLGLFKGWSENDYEFILRIKNAENYELQKSKE